MFLFRQSSPAVKEEPPDTWEEDDKDELQQEKENKERHRYNDKDLEFLFQEVVRDCSLDDDLRQDLQNKRSDPRYREMLVSGSVMEVLLEAENKPGLNKESPTLILLLKLFCRNSEKNCRLMGKER